MSKAISIALTKLLCIEETDGFFLDDDEPYLIVFTGNLSSLPPAAEATMYPFTNVSSGELHVTIPMPPGTIDIDPLGKLGIPLRRLCWGINGKPAPIPDADKIIILVALMENDNADVNGVREAVKAMMTASLIAGMHLSRSELVSKLIKDMSGGLDDAAAFGGMDPDERIGSVKELRFRKKDIANAAKGAVVKRLDFSGEGAQYRARFEMTTA